MNSTVKENLLILFFYLLISTNIFSIDNLGQIGKCYINAGVCYETKFIDNFAFIGCQYGLLILDITDIENPTQVGSFETPSTCFSLDLKDDYAFLACTSDGVIIVDISDYLNPVFLSSYNFSISYMIAGKIVIQEDIVFISGGYNGSPYLQIVNFEDIYNPIELFFDDSNYYRDFYVVDEYLYAVNYECYVLDISQLNNLVLIDSLDCCNWQPSLDIYNQKAYIIDDGALKIVDISDPYNLNLINVFDDLDTNPKDIVVANNCAYLTGTNGLGFTVIDITDPLNLEILTEIEYQGNRIAMHNNNVLISKYGNGFQTSNGIGIFEVINFTNVNLISEYKTCLANNIFICEDYAYIANGFSGLKILNISNPQNPYTITEFLTIDKAKNVIVESQIAYVALSNSGLQILDVSNPSQPSQICSISTPFGDILSVVKYDDYLYLGGESLGYVFIYNVEDVYNPILVNQLSVNDFSYDLDIFENFLFTAGYWGGLQIFTLGNPESPIEVGYFPLDLAFCVEADEGITFIGDPYTTLRVFDTENLANPILTSTYQIGYIEDIVFKEDILYTASSSGIHIFNVEDPYNIIELAIISDCNPKGVFCDENYLYSVENFDFKLFGDTTLVSSDINLLNQINYSVEFENYPNPFNPYTLIKFNTYFYAVVEISVYNVKSQKVKSLVNREFNPGTHEILWDGSDNDNKKLCSGIYLFNVSINGKSSCIKKCFLLK